MSNTIDLNLGGNNSMEPPTFIWIALFKDNSKIEQYENETEHKFKEVQDKINELAYFNLTDKKGHMFTVDLINGRIGYNYLPLSYLEAITDKNNIRLIFFRRHRVEITESNIEKSHTIEYHLGLQYQDLEKRNHKIILIIDESGSFTIG